MRKKEKKKEQVRILIGGISYRGQVVEGRELAEGDELLELLEDVGKEGDVGGAALLFPAGATIPCRWDGTRHQATRERQFTAIDGEGAGVRANHLPAPAPAAVMRTDPVAH